MEVLLEQAVRADAVAAVCRRSGELVVTGDRRTPSPAYTPLTGLAQVVDEAPLVVAGRLPEGVVGVRVLWPGNWVQVVAGGGAWLGVAADDPVSEQPIWGLAFDCGDGTFEPIPDPDAEAGAMSLEIGEPNDEGRAYAATLAAAIAADLARDAPPGPLRRLVVRWSWENDPLYLTIHALAAGDPQPALEDAWLPLEWDVGERELARTDRVLARTDVHEAAAALTATFRNDDDDDGLAHLPAVIELVRRLPAALRAQGVALGDPFAAVAAHFEGWGARSSLEATATPEVRAALEVRGEMPPD